MDVVATAVLNNGARIVLVWPSGRNPERKGFVSPPTETDKSANWYEVADPGVTEDLGWALWEKVHPADPGMRSGAYALFHQLHETRPLRKTGVLDIAPTVLVPLEAPGAREMAEQWQAPLRAETEDEMTKGWLEYNTAVGASHPAELAVITTGFGGSATSIFYLMTKLDDMRRLIEEALLGDGTVTSGGPILLGLAGLVGSAAIMSAPEGTRLLKDWISRRRYRQLLKYASENVPAAAYTDETAEITGIRLPVLPTRHDDAKTHPGIPPRQTLPPAPEAPTR